MKNALHPHEIQTAVFRQLLTYETLLKPEYKLRIDRLISGVLFVYVITPDTGTPHGCLYWKLNPANISTFADVDEHLNLFWDEVPQYYKRKEQA